MDENVVFKTAAVGGFEKRAVLDYIYQMNEQTELDKQELRNRIIEMEEGLRLAEDNAHAAGGSLRTAQRDLSTVSSELAEEKKARLELLASREELEKEVLRQKDITKNKELEVQEFINKNKGVLEQNKSLEAQQEELDKASYQLGRVMLDARTDSDNIVSTAREQAKELINQAETDIGEMKQRSEQEATDLLTSAREKAQAELDFAKKQGERTVKDAQAVADKTLKETKEQSDLSLAHVRERALAIVGVTSETADISTVHLRELRRETLAIRQGVADAFSMLQEKADELDGLIGGAQETVAQEQVALSAKKLTEIPEINMADMEKAYINEQGGAAEEGPETPEKEDLSPEEETSKDALKGNLEAPVQETPPWAEVKAKEEVEEIFPEITLKLLEQKEPELVAFLEEDKAIPETEDVVQEAEIFHLEPELSEVIEVRIEETLPPFPLGTVSSEDPEGTIGSESHLLAKDAFPSINLTGLMKEDNSKDEVVGPVEVKEEEQKEQDNEKPEEKRELPPYEPLHAWERRGDKQVTPVGEKEGKEKESSKSYPPGLEAPDKDDASTQGTFF